MDKLKKLATEANIEQTVIAPDLGGVQFDVTELLVSVGDTVAIEQGLITIEGDKAAMELPSPYKGTVTAINVELGSKISQGDSLFVIAVIKDNQAINTSDVKKDEKQDAKQALAADIQPLTAVANEPSVINAEPAVVNKLSTHIYASPSVRRLAREFGVDLTNIVGTGVKRRILKQDVQSYIKTKLTKNNSELLPRSNVDETPEIDYSLFGEIERIPLNRIQKISGANLHKNWLNIPHVTQFDKADITDLESFRKQQNQQMIEKSQVKISPLIFAMKLVAKALLNYPKFNTSLAKDGNNIIYKKYINISIAVDTAYGLVVPVIRNVDTKGIIALTREVRDISIKAREKQLSPADMQGGCFTISSLGGIGGSQFTPIINATEVAILGISKATIQPKWDELTQTFKPRLILPLALSYDHRVIDGADAARFITYLTALLEDARKLML